ncbi:hypothetical protein LTR35_010890 [Friedmanniomyces endolithicus]|nr:hypothetical protein LTS00_015099 [Friedmanniomyces endolithicus]KAK0275620.1 hypothetical protein LTR35_010890 [Friedmanniomyces endolithicus]KAK0992588.1 hypothetical protein LTR54_011459 [Friedmanniomyces endolithicus]
MADGLSIAASAIQVADAGFKLYGALSQYIKDYVDANKHVRRLADEVRTTSWALQQLWALLKEDDDIKLCKPEAIGETEAALKGCQRAFDEVSDIIKGFLPSPKPDGSGGLAKSSISNRWKWPLKTAKVQLLLAQLERLKTTLLLIFKVITYASKLASRTSPKETLLPDEKSQLLYLLKAKQDAVEIEEKLLGAVVQHPPWTLIVKPEVTLGAYGQHNSPLPMNKTTFGYVDSAPSNRGSTDSTDEPLTYPGLISGARAEPMPPPISCTNFVGAVLLPEQFEIPKRSLSPTHKDTTGPKKPPRLSGRKRGLVARLDDCVAAVERLTLTLNHAKAELQSDNPLVVHHVTRSFRSTKRAIDALVSTEMDADSESATSDRGLGQSKLSRGRNWRPSRARVLQRGTNEPQFDFYWSSIDRSRSRRSRSRSRREVAAGPPIAPAGGLAQASVAELYERVTTRPHDEPRLGAYAYAKPSALVASDTTQKDSVLPISTSDLEYDATTKPAGTSPGHETGEGMSSNPPSEQTTHETWAPARKNPTKSSWGRSLTLSRESEAQRRQLVRPPEALADNAAPPNPKNDSSTAEHESPQITELEGSALGDAKHAERKSSIRPLNEPLSSLSGMVTRPQRPLRRSGVPRGHRKKISAPGLNPRVSTGSLDDISPNNAIGNPAPEVARNSSPSLSPPDLGLALGDPHLVSPASPVVATGSTEHAIPPIHLESIACDDDIDEDAWSLEASYDMNSLDLGLESGEGGARSMKACLVLPQDSPESKAVDTTNPCAADVVTLDRDRMSYSHTGRRRVVSRSDEYYQLPARVMENTSPETYDVVESEEDSDIDGGPEEEYDTDGGAEEEGEICDGAEGESDMEGVAEEESDIDEGTEEESNMDGGAEEEGDIFGGVEEEGDIFGGAEEESDSVESGEDSDMNGGAEEGGEDLVDELIRRWTTVMI